MHRSNNAVIMQTEQLGRIEALEEWSSSSKASIRPSCSVCMITALFERCIVSSAYKRSISGKQTRIHSSISPKLGPWPWSGRFLSPPRRSTDRIR